MKKLKVIPYDKLLTQFDLYRNPDADDRLETQLKLNDYSWMTYEISTFFPTKKYGNLDVHFIYSGTTVSDLYIKQYINDKLYSHHLVFDSKIFEKYITLFMKKHIDSWKSKYAFCGEKIVLDFYNEVIENNIKYDIGELSSDKIEGVNL